jgi:CBS domain-containing protein
MLLPPNYIHLDPIGIDIKRPVPNPSDLMAKKWIRHLLATENDTLVGILSVRDLIRTVALKDRPWFLCQKKNFFLTSFLG